MFVEQIRRPQRFLALAQRARARAASRIVADASGPQPARARLGELAHRRARGRSRRDDGTAAPRGRDVVETLEELVDTAELLARFKPPVNGPGIITNSGAVKGFALDFCDPLGLDIPRLGERDARRAEGRACRPSRRSTIRWT